MKTINELMNECTEAMNKHVALQEEDDKLKEDLKEVVLKNWKIALAEIEAFEKFRGLLAGTFHKYPTFDEIGQILAEYDCGLTLMIKSENSAWASSAKILLLGEGGVSLDYLEKGLFNKENPFRTDIIPSWAVLLNTEEKAKAFANKVAEYYAKVAQFYLDNIIPTESGALRDSIANVKALLTDSHTVEEKEDGTVEIKLGGKVYIGTLKEE